MRDAAKEKQKRFGWEDAVALFLAILMFLGALVYYRYSKREPPETVELICVLLISGLDVHDWEVYGNHWVQIGEPLYSSNGTVILGYVEEIHPREHLRLVIRDGEPIWEEHPFLVDLEISVRMSATYREGDGLRAGDLRIAAGGRGDFRFGDLLSGAQILEVREVKRE